MIRHLAMVAMIGFIATGCAMSVATPQASLPVLESIRDAKIAPLRVGSFAPDAALPRGADGSIGLRAMTIASPVNGSWSAFLAETVRANLRAAGKLDSDAPLVLQGFLTESDVGTGLPDGHAKLGARFTLSKDGKALFDRHLVVEDHWQSSLIGQEAIPDASNHYIGLYGQLVRSLFADPAFQAAAAP